MTTIYFEPAGRLHSMDRELMANPPEGYRFIAAPAGVDEVSGRLMANDYLYFVLQRSVLDRIVPMRLTKALVEGALKRRPAGAALTFARNHLVFRNEPWIAHIEWAHALIGSNPIHLELLRGFVRRQMESPNCRRIITWCELARRSIEANYGSEAVSEKLVVLPHAVGAKRFRKEFDDRRIKLLFVGSGNTPAHIPGAEEWAAAYNFHAKGGKEVLAAFDRLSARYDNLELVMRCPVPEETARRYAGRPNVRLLRENVPWEVLEHEFQTADIFLYPTHLSTWQVMLDAQSYELPVITTNVQGNSELIVDGKTGFLIAAAAGVPYWWKRYIPAGASPLSGALDAALLRTHADVIEHLVARTGQLIENQALRREMGRAARAEVEMGRLSIARRNAALGAIFDTALGVEHATPSAPGAIRAASERGGSRTDQCRS